MKKIYFSIIYTLLSSFLAGCLATADLASEQELSPGDKLIAQKIASLGSQICTRHTYDPATNVKKSGEMKITSNIVIKRFYKSEGDWFKVEAVADGVWDNIFYNKSSGQIVCGQKQWDSYSNAKGIEFREHSSVAKKL